MEDSRNTFKVTALSIRHSINKTERLVLYNVTLPVHLISNENMYNVIRDTIVYDFDNNSGIYFDLSAVYTLVNLDTGELPTCTESFHPRKQPNQLTTHRRFEPDTFMEFAKQHSSVERAMANYIGGTGGHARSLQDLKSIEFSFQCKLRASHRLFQHRRPQLQHVRASETLKQHEFNLEAG
jgi:hypothetical protein